jgi:DNA-binding CsgD family transcriptional regulator
VQAMTTLYAAWASVPPPPPASATCLLSSSNWPAHLRMRTFERDASVVQVSFSLARLRALTRCELEVARWANAGYSNAAIASLRQKSIHTVVRQMASLLPKLGIGSRLALATIAELNAWSPPRLGIPSHEDPSRDSWRWADGLAVEPAEVAHIWREIALGNWRPLMSVDMDGTSHVVMRRVSDRRVNWGELDMVQRDALALAAEGAAQKAIAMKLGMAPSTVSAVLTSACRRLEFPSLGQLLRAYCAAMDAIDKPRPIAGIPVPQAARTGVGSFRQLPSSTRGDQRPASVRE